MNPDLPAVLAAIPLIAAPLAVIFSRFGKMAWVISLTALWAMFAISLVVFDHTYLDHKVISYAMGGWAPPFGIEYQIDALTALFLVIICGIGAMCMPYAYHSVRDEILKERQPYFYACFLMTIAGLVGIVSTNDAFNLYVFVEIASLSSYALIGLGKDRRSLSAAFQYLILGTIGATFILIGVGYLYLMTGTLNFDDLARKLDEITFTAPIYMAFAFIAVGLCMKIALYPLHVWLPNAYAYAPSAVSAFFAGVATKVMVYAVIRFFYTLFGFNFSFHGMHLALVFSALSVPAMLLAGTVAMFQTNLKRMFAFSSISQLGIITLGIGLASPLGLTAALVHIINHAVIKCTIFLALGCFAYRLSGRASIEAISGLGRHMPFTSLAFVIAGLGLIGVPLTGGFISKWYILMATLQGGWWLLTGVVIISSLLSIVYVWRVVETLYFGKICEQYNQTVEAPAMMVIPLWVMVGIIIWLGVDTRLSVDIATFITKSFMPAAVMEVVP